MLRKCEELRKELDAQHKEAVDAANKKREAHKKAIMNLADAIFKKYSDIMEKDLKTIGRTTFCFETSGYHFANDHVIDPGMEVQPYEIVYEMRKRFLDLGYDVSSMSRDTVFAEMV